MDKMDLIDSEVTLDEVFEWLKNEIESGRFQQVKDRSDEELLRLVKVAKQLIEIELKLAEAFACEQVTSIKKKIKVDIIIHMNHIAIMKRSWGLIPKIISGEKTIESRWYKNRIVPWDRINEGDTVYFKDSGEPVSAVATVSKVLQFSDLDETQFSEIMAKYADDICLKTREFNEYYQSKNYCILIFLTKPQKLDKPFNIDKTGYGISSAWMCIDNLNKVKI